MHKSTQGMKLKPHFIPLKSDPNTYRCVTNIGTPEEKYWGMVFREDKFGNSFSNSRGDGKIYATRTLAGRDLVERKF